MKQALGLLFFCWLFSSVVCADGLTPTPSPSAQSSGLLAAIQKSTAEAQKELQDPIQLDLKNAKSQEKAFLSNTSNTTQSAQKHFKIGAPQVS